MVVGKAVTGQIVGRTALKKLGRGWVVRQLDRGEWGKEAGSIRFEADMWLL